MSFTFIFVENDTIFSIAHSYNQPIGKYVLRYNLFVKYFINM